MRGSISFHPTPGSPASPFFINHANKPYDTLLECLSRDLDRNENDFVADEVFWGAESQAEVVLLDGTIIGSLDFPLSPDELAAIGGASAA